MTMPTAPEHEALRLASRLEAMALALPAYGFDQTPLTLAAAELRRLHALTQTGGWTLTFADERDFCLTASPLIGAAYGDAAAAVERINTSPRGRKSFGKITATAPTSPPPSPEQAEKEGG